MSSTVISRTALNGLYAQIMKRREVMDNTSCHQYLCRAHCNLRGRHVVSVAALFCRNI